MRYTFAGLFGTKKQKITREQAKAAFLLIPKSQRKCVPSPGLLHEGMNVEIEHQNVTHGSLKKTAMIAAAHICERPDYYKRLKKYVE